ncbi:PAS domain-containing protein [Sphingosinicella sp. CPCC 101087]|uniref:PAS domain-containing protein n=1 Tax=Sphingosinicella sp. CPCC 101087 TaxID=2497754 RepID=UPI00101BD63F|nr:PAS domain-containing protein [Sphingosinicella sp. CPCC 101087]
MSGFEQTSTSTSGGGSPVDIFLAGGGEAGALIRSHDWSSTPLGPPEHWPVALKTLVGVMLGSSRPMFVTWGSGRTLLYNDAYGEILASKHPGAMGQDFLEVWHEIRDDLIPIVDQAYRGQPVQMDDIELWMERKGYREEAHFAFSYTPVRSENGAIDGFFCVCQEITRQVNAERDLRESEARAQADAQRVRLALDAGAIIGTWFYDIQADQFTVDEQFANAFGIDPELGRSGLGLDQMIATVHPEDKPGLMAAVEEAIARGGPYAHQYRVRRTDGRYYWIEANGRVDKADDGTPLSFPGVLLDIEERRRTETALRASEEFNRRVLASSADCIMVLDLDGRIEFMSEGGLGVMEVEDFDSVRGAVWPDLWHGDENAKVVGAIEDAKRGGTGRFQSFARTMKGSPRWWDVAVTPISDGAGRPEKLLAVSRDITATMEAEAALRETSRRLDAILNNTGQAVFLMDDRQHCVYANAAAEKLTGYRLDEMRERPLHDVLHHKRPDGSHYPIEECPIDRAFPARSQMSGEEWFVSPNGSLYPVAFTASPLLDDAGNAVGTVIEARSIAVEKARDEALQEQARTLETLNRTGEAVAAELDLERVVQTVTDAGVELTGAKFGAFFYNVLNEAGEAFMLYTLSGADRSEFERFGMPRATAVFKPTFVGEGVIRSDDILADPRYGKNAPHRGMPKGHLPVRSYLAVPVASRSGEVIGGLFFGHPEPGKFGDNHERLMVGIAAQAAIAIDNARLYQAAQREIDERRRAEERLLEFNENLEERVAEEIAGRTKAEEALMQAQKMDAVGQLTGGIAHDFNNLLTIVTGNIDMAARAMDAAGKPDPRARRALGNALKGAERAAALTQRLLAFSRRQPLAPKALDADRLVAGMSDLLNRALGETVSLEIVTSPGLWRVEADPNQLEAAILNLAVNAKDAMPGGGTVTVETANARLDEAYAAEHAEVAPGQYVVIAVTDTGVGMSKEIAARVFEPFFTTKEVGRGTGLGLSQVYGFTKQSGGHVKIYSEEGRGTSVKIYLPRLISDVQVEQEGAGAGVEVSRARETILVVEDDDDVRAYSVECLRELGYRVLQAHDGPTALRVLEREEQPVDLLFTDVVMPGMTGRELADQAREKLPNLKVLYTSGYTRNAIVHGGRLDEGVEMIGKPFTYEMLSTKIADVLDKGRTGRILLVDDEATLRMFASEALGAAGYAVDEAASGAEALARVRAGRGCYDAVVLDVQLTNSAGDTVAFELRGSNADLPILLASEEPVDDLVARVAGDRCMGVIAKPYNAAKLTRALEALGARCRVGGVQASNG